jgi:hypothetical protein
MDVAASLRSSTLNIPNSDELLASDAYGLLFPVLLCILTCSNPMAKLAQDAKNAATMGQWAEDLKTHNFQGLINDARGFTQSGEHNSHQRAGCRQAAQGCDYIMV